MRVDVVTRGHDYKAFLDGDPARWGCGRTIHEAIGDAIFTHDKSLKVVIDGTPREDLGKKEHK